MRSITIEANSKQEAFEKWTQGDWDSQKIEETDCEGLSSKDEILEEMYEIE